MIATQDSAIWFFRQRNGAPRNIQVCNALYYLQVFVSSLRRLHSRNAAASDPLPTGSKRLAVRFQSFRYPAGLALPHPAKPMFSPAHPHAETDSELKKMAEQAATTHTLPTDYFMRLIRQESGFNPNSLSHAGAQGIAQFMPATAFDRGLKDPFDPAEALPKSAELLNELRDAIRQSRSGRRRL